MTKRIIDTKPGVKSTDYRDNADETKTNYKDKNKMDYRDFEDINLTIIYNNILLPLFCSAENPVLEDIASMVEFDIM